MSSKGLKTIFRIGDDVTTSEIKGPNTIMFQTGDAATSSPGFEAESWQHVGFASRPSSISGSGDNALAAQALVIPRSDFDIVFATRDTRYQDIYGALKPGETCIYGTGSDGGAQGRVLIKMDGSINLFTSKGNAKGGAGMGIFVDAMAGSITLAAPKKAALILDDTGAKLFSPKGAVQIMDDGLKITSSAKIGMTAPQITLGGPAATAVINAKDLTALVGLIATAVGAAGPGGPAAATAFTTAAGNLITALATTKRVWAD